MAKADRLYRRLLETGPRSAGEWLFFVLLVAASRLFGLLVAARRSAYAAGICKSYRASIPIVSVGNLTVGGTGKTPVVDYLVKHALKGGIRAAIVSRGYGGRRKAGTVLVSDGRGTLNDDARLFGDEPVLLARRNPEAIVVVARKRSEGVRLSEQLGAELVVLDDGFQHLALERDLDIVLLDAERPFGNHRLLPAGPLREPVTAIKRCDLVIQTRSQADVRVELPADRPLLRCRHVLSEQVHSLNGQIFGWDAVRGKRCLAFAGIAHPQDFFSSLRQRGVDLKTEVFLADHQEYDPETLKQLRRACHNCDLAMTTEKDAVKLHSSAFPIPCFHVVLDVVIQDPGPLEAALDKLTRRSHNDTSSRPA